MPEVKIELSPVELDDMRRLVDRLNDRSGKQLDLVRQSMLRKLRRAVLAAQELHQPIFKD